MSVTLDDFGRYETAWCPGCGNFSILQAVKQSLVALDLAPHQVLFVSGIGQAAKAPHYLNANVFNGLHGRSLPVATGAKLANPDLVVIAQSGDGCMYGEGGNHLLAAIRRNPDITVLAHDNRVYGLTKGQASPTSAEGFVTKAQPGGTLSVPFNPVEVAIAMRAGFVGRGFSGMVDHLADLIAQAINHRGFSMVDILQPCVTFNRVNTLKWFKDRCYVLEEDHAPEDRRRALDLASGSDEAIALGVLYRNDRPAFHERFPVLHEGSLVGRPINWESFRKVLDSYL